MKTKFNKIAKTAAVGIFFMALFFNVKVSLEDPFVTISNDALAQTSSSIDDSTAPICCQEPREFCTDRFGFGYSDSTAKPGPTCP